MVNRWRKESKDAMNTISAPALSLERGWFCTIMRTLVMNLSICSLVYISSSCFSVLPQPLVLPMLFKSTAPDTTESISTAERQHMAFFSLFLISLSFNCPLPP